MLPPFSKCLKIERGKSLGRYSTSFVFKAQGTIHAKTRRESMHLDSLHQQTIQPNSLV